LWASGLKAAAIAKELNREFGTAYTKNAVIGTKHRAGLDNRQSRTPKAVVKQDPKPNWRVSRFINGTRMTLDTFISVLSNDWNKTPTQIAERVNDEWGLSMIGVYATHLNIHARLVELGITPVKTQKHPKVSNMTGSFGHAPAQFETAPKHVDVTKLGATNEQRMGTNERNSCKWPTSDDARNMQTCGRLITVGSYCQTHGALAYQIRPSKRRTAVISKPQEFAEGPAKVNGNRKHHIVDEVAATELPHASEWLNG